MGLKARVPLYVSTGTSAEVTVEPMPIVTPDILEGDFGFGNVKVTSLGDILEYQPAELDVSITVLPVKLFSLSMVTVLYFVYR